ncbi:type II toxin-antitoxin system CcdA family antitoxin [Pseudocitrobacter cyperus]|uniref:Uncharacterized protein n=1 Tax=Pseudocitrobacter cyperus TaxID=3112843 RepID=A0ABV0HEV3_9ENTR
MKTTAMKNTHSGQPTSHGERCMNAEAQKQQHDKEFMQAMNELVEKYGAFTDDDFFKVI